MHEGTSEHLVIASRNIPNFSVKRAEQVNPYDLLLFENVLVTEQGLEKIKETFKND